MSFRIAALLLTAALLSGVLSPALAGPVNAAPQPSHAAVVHTHAPAAAFDKTRFLLHLGVAAFLVHYIYKKYKEGKLGRFHIFTDIKAAAAALIAYHEMKVAYTIAKTSNSATLHLLISPISALTGTLGTLASKLKTGNTSAVSTANSQEASLQSTAGKNGYAYKDQQPSGFAGF